jgi:hypothetical protein
MFVPTWLMILVIAILLAVVCWALLLATGRNPLPFPDPGSRIFTATSPQAKEAITSLQNPSYQLRLS